MQALMSRRSVEPQEHYHVSHPGREVPTQHIHHGGHPWSTPTAFSAQPTVLGHALPVRLGDTTCCDAGPAVGPVPLGAPSTLGPGASGRAQPQGREGRQQHQGGDVEEHSVVRLERPQGLRLAQEGEAYGQALLQHDASHGNPKGGPQTIDQAPQASPKAHLMIGQGVAPSRVPPCPPWGRTRRHRVSPLAAPDLRAEDPGCFGEVCSAAALSASRSPEAALSSMRARVSVRAPVLPRRSSCSHSVRSSAVTSTTYFFLGMSRHSSLWGVPRRSRTASY